MNIPSSLVGMADCVARESSRYSINGVLVRCDGNGNSLAAATDGRRLVVCKWDDAGKAMEAVVPSGIWKLAMVGAHPSKPVEASLSGGKLTLARPDFSLTCEPLEVKFPKFEDLFVPEKFAFGFNGELIAPLLEIAKAVRPDDKPIFKVASAEKPTLLAYDVSVGVELRALMMPVNLSSP